MAIATDNFATALEAARFIHAFVECNRQTQENVLEMAAIIRDPESTPEERTLAGDAIMECLCPMMAVDIQDEYPTRVKSEGAAKLISDLHDEDKAFADKVRQYMAQNGVTQEMLAQKAGIGQPAVSNIINRRCRPQRKTVVKFAEALGVEPQELWPGFKVNQS